MPKMQAVEQTPQSSKKNITPKTKMDPTTSATEKQAFQDLVAIFVKQVSEDLLTVAEVKTEYCTKKMQLTDEVWQAVEASERAVDDVLYGNRDTATPGVLALIANYVPQHIPKIQEKMQTYQAHMRTFKGLLMQHCRSPFRAKKYATIERRMEDVLEKESTSSVKWVKWIFESKEVLQIFSGKQRGLTRFFVSILLAHKIEASIAFLMIYLKYGSFLPFFRPSVVKRILEEVRDIILNPKNPIRILWKWLVGGTAVGGTAAATAATNFARDAGAAAVPVFSESTSAPDVSLRITIDINEVTNSLNRLITVMYEYVGIFVQTLISAGVAIKVLGFDVMKYLRGKDGPRLIHQRAFPEISMMNSNSPSQNPSLNFTGYPLVSTDYTTGWPYTTTTSYILPSNMNMNHETSLDLNIGTGPAAIIGQGIGQDISHQFSAGRNANPSWLDRLLFVAYRHDVMDSVHVFNPRVGIE